VSGVLQPTLAGFTRALGRAIVSEQIAHRRGLLQSFDPRVRLVGLFSLVLAVVLSRKLSVIGAIFALAVLVALLSGVTLGTLVKRVWLVVLAFTGLIALPALFVTPGTAIWASRGGGVQITAQGLTSAVLLIARVETAVTLTTLLVLCTPWMQVLRALRALQVPQVVVVMLAMTHRYIFLLTETAGQMLESRQSRLVGRLRAGERRRMMANSAGALLGKSMDLSGEVYQAMQARGFRGEFRTLSPMRMRGLDIAGLAGFLAMAVAAVWMGR
jgi:cobalt ECF transporter T component CbiQ